MHRGVLAIVVLAASAVAGGAAPPFSAQTVAGETRQDGEAKWTYDLVRLASPKCAKSKPDDCVENLVRIGNDSSLPIQCHVWMKLPRKDDKGRKFIEHDVVVYPGRLPGVAMSYGPVALVPRSFEASCVTIPATIEPYSMPVECHGRAQVPSPADFYPVGAKRRREEGNVVIEYDVNRGPARELRNVLVVDGSGFEELDSAALLLSKYVRVWYQCPDRRYRMTIRFVLTESV